MLFLRWFIVISLVLIITAIVSSIIVSVSKKNAIKKMYLDIEGVIDSTINPDNKEEYSLKKEYKREYTYVYDTPVCTYYIKVIPNFSNEEICVNNSVKWQLRKSFNDESMRFVEDVEGLMRMDIESRKPYKKLYVIYPNARSLLKYINECEMVFINYDTDVYGTNIISYVQFEDTPSVVLKTENEINKEI